ncbi:TetM/TetW/TetO/TetS family tetracycline resistance ribosomal protection protein [Collinsella sp. An2]|uniref:elongation factor G n=1 Tax=Collinsella sp. An2 TaxID=1965585 RepID=UPI000B37A001|nr:TetM/TetW/TetO/TetS family tetracycline resistance ribosomal protection protein [Collinsella sp. An2]OUP06560.1 GTP-binding protein [Collinsella sp. An2]
MRQAVVGMLAHVDAGKTTLVEAMLFEAGAIRKRGRVDHGDAHLDTDAMERERGITIFSKQTSLDYDDVHLMILDAPGHVDFSAEAERTLQALDYAVLVVGANDGVQGHTETLWDLLARYEVPTIIFINKLDLAGTDAEALLTELQGRLDAACLDGQDLLGGGAACEDAAATDEDALDEYLEGGGLILSTLRRLVRERKVFPCFSGSALRGEGVAAFLDGLAALVDDRTWPQEFAARVYKVSRSPRGERLAWLKVTGGALRAKMLLDGVDGGEVWTEKVDQVRIYDADAFQTVSEVSAGRVCTVTGLSHVVPGSALGAEPAGEPPVLAPVLSYQVLPGDHDVHAVVHALRELADEDPMLAVSWEEHLQEIHIQLMGSVQREVVQQLLLDRYGLGVGFGPGGILYKETVTASVEGIGHFEPLRHYAEAHLLLEPLPRGAGVQVGTRCSEDDLDRNWQRLILTHVLEREHRGVLTGSPLTDVRITLLGGRAHAKHTEGGDFRQATYRAIREGLMQAKAQGTCELLEPWYRFRLVVPAEKVGRALADLQRMSAVFDPPAMEGDTAFIAGTAPASEMQEYALEVNGYSGGRGRLALEYAGYQPCHNAQEVIEAVGYDPESDVPNTPDSVFCSHGAGYTVKWHEVPEHAHVSIDPARLRPWREADAAFFSSGA